ncbi:MAG: hypothetical protein F4Z00_00315 [Acidimicrobiaceae bacterium]|nr:hypothetical protein [Acidimicrobiaceae bacterium]MXZ63986.1 hypothetical protein [Acidimicrobiaceae bacterium]MYF31952.1 hypothetical protein [Acidimicrobiaceae bacterium]MYG76977.1 hypothetical protein [Acidimicrobiaceae bacterium]MYG77797.1 hypothetical protein [Acidimicrobiaceae bacterium]
MSSSAGAPDPPGGDTRPNTGEATGYAPVTAQLLDAGAQTARRLLGPWWNERSRRALFGVLITAGFLVGLVLGLRDVYDRPVLDVGEPRVRVEGLTATVQVTVRNTSEDIAYCPVVGVAALDRDGLDLAKAPTSVDLGDARLAPKASANFVGVLTGISQQDFDEQLSDYAAFVEQENPCP